MPGGDDALHAELALLREEVARLAEEKSDLEILLDTVTHHSDFIEKELERTVQALMDREHTLAEERETATRLREALAKASSSAVDAPL
jgi:CII-binding regulator of phage lambda lysogenization HflD